MLEHREDPTKAVTEYPLANVLQERHRWTAAEILAAVVLFVWFVYLIASTVSNY